MKTVIPILDTFSQCVLEVPRFPSTHGTSAQLLLQICTFKHVDKTSNLNSLVNRTILKATVILLPLLGLTWVFGVLTIDRNTTVFAWLFTIFNSTQVWHMGHDHYPIICRVNQTCTVVIVQVSHYKVTMAGPWETHIKKDQLLPHLLGIKFLVLRMSNCILKYLHTLHICALHL